MIQSWHAGTELHLLKIHFSQLQNEAFEKMIMDLG